MPAPLVTGVLETSLYVEDVARSRRFYADLFGLEVLAEDQRFCAMSVAGRDVLLLFKRGATLQPVAIPGGIVPQHDGGGQLHFALRIRREELDAWEKRLASNGISVESRAHWPLGGTSLYFRDPDQHLVELATPGIWPIF